MGTNYYIVDNVCDKCGRYDEIYHIGKSSGGWCFSLHVEPERGINTLGDIRKLWENLVIKDEYEESLLPEEMLDIIMNRKWKSRDSNKPYGYKSWDEFHKQNGSESGPNGLVRSRIDGRHCVGHGDGTWDLIVGEFS